MVTKIGNSHGGGCGENEVLEGVWCCVLSVFVAVVVIIMICPHSSAQLAPDTLLRPSGVTLIRRFGCKIY